MSEKLINTYLLTRRNPLGMKEDYASGAVMSSEALGRALGSLGVRITLLTLQGIDELRGENEPFTCGFRTINFGAQTDGDILSVLYSQQQDYDLIHIRGSTFPDLRSRQAVEGLSALGKPIIYTLVVEGALENLEIPRNLFAAVVGLSRKVCNELKAYGFSPVYHIPNAIDTSEFNPEVIISGTGEMVRNQLGIAPDAPVFLVHCRIDREKNLALLGKLWPLVFARHPNARLILAGAPAPGRTEMEELYGHLKRTDGIYCVGRVDLSGVLRLAAASNILITTSVREGLSRSLLEGMAMGLVPVADAETAGNADVIDHGINGFLYDRENPSSLVQTMESLITLYGSDRESLMEMGKRARETIVSKHCIYLAAERYLRLYKYILGTGREGVDDLVYV